MQHPDSWNTMFAVHARAPFFMVQAALGQLSAKAHGSSTSHRRPGSDLYEAVPIYSMAKAAINKSDSCARHGTGTARDHRQCGGTRLVRTDMNAAVRESSRDDEGDQCGYRVGSLRRAGRDCFGGWVSRLR